MSVRGFSLIEVMVSVGLFTVGLFATLSAYNNASTVMEHHRHTTVAINSAEAVLEDLLLLKSGDPALDAGIVCMEHEGARVPCAGSARRYEVAWRSTAHATIAGVRHLTVTVRWNEGLAEVPRTFTLATQRD